MVANNNRSGSVQQSRKNKKIEANFNPLLKSATKGDNKCYGSVINPKDYK